MGIYKDGVYYEPAPYKTCGECGARYQPGSRGWHNHFLCSARCCALRRAKLAPLEPEEEPCR